MHSNYRIATLLLVASMCATHSFAQQDAPATQTDSEPATEPVQPDQEVEVNEDNYRQFMELKDGLQQRTIAPQDSFESRSGLQKLDQLPEASQKHLRDQLREVISQGDRWQPGDENADYPYVPSEAARANAKLQGQEAEAWGELLDNYHAREAQIHANSARTRAALAGSNAAMGSGDGESGEESESRSGQGQQGGEQSASQPGGAAASFSPGAQGGSATQEAEGVSQNAMEFLQNAGYQGGSAGEEGSQQQTGDAGQMSGQTQQGTQQGAAQASTQNPGANPGAQDASQAQDADGSEQNAMQYLQQMGQQGSTGESGAEQAGDDSEASPASSQEAMTATDSQTLTTATGSSESEEIAAEGVSQNAMQYLQQMEQQGSTGASGAEQAGDGNEASPASSQEAMTATDSQTLSIETGSSESDETAAEGVSQNALEYLSGEGSAEGEATPDTLSIEDLLQAQGVVIGVGADAPQEPDDPPKDPPD